MKRGNGFVDITGQEFGGLTVVEQAPSVDGAAAWKCLCECGEEVVVKGTQLRKGNRRSCGCKDPQKRRPSTAPRKPSAATASASPMSGHFWVVELDGFVALVESTRHGEALVEFNPSAKSWECSVCGPQPKLVCGHVAAVTARLPVETALRIASITTPAKDGPLSSRSGGAAEGNSANEKARAVALAKSAIERAARVSRHDEQHRTVVGEVTVRQMTPEDRERLAEKRRRKRALVGAPEAG